MSKRRAHVVLIHVAVIALTALAAATSPLAELYAQTYPTDSVVDGAEELEAALADAELTWEFDSEHLTENERSQLTATIVYDTEPTGGGVEVKVAFANDASLTPATPGQFQISWLTAPRQRLDQGNARPGGGFELSWIWDVVPRASGDLRLLLEIQPVVLVDGDVLGGFLEKVNTPVPVGVNVHPNRLAFDEVLAAAMSDLDVDVPREVTKGEPVDVVATLPLPNPADALDISISVQTGTGSAPARIEDRGQVQPVVTNGRLIHSWVITAVADGLLSLVFTVSVTAPTGDQTLEDSVLATRSIAVTKSLSERSLDFFIVLGTILGVIGAAAAIADRFFGLRGKVRTWWTRRRGGSPPPAPAEP